MKQIQRIIFKEGSNEELLPDFAPEFPYIASYVEIDRYVGRQAPWHWHREVELFYIQQGILEYHTPKGKTVFPAGSGGAGQFQCAPHDKGAGRCSGYHYADSHL